MTVYEARASTSSMCSSPKAGGAGLLQAKFEALKRKLEAEGLFDPESQARTASLSRVHRHRHVSDRKRRSRTC